MMEKFESYHDYRFNGGNPLLVIGDVISSLYGEDILRWCFLHCIMKSIHSELCEKLNELSRDMGIEISAVGVVQAGNSELKYNESVMAHRAGTTFMAGASEVLKAHAEKRLSQWATKRQFDPLEEI